MSRIKEIVKKNPLLKKGWYFIQRTQAKFELSYEQMRKNFERRRQKLSGTQSVFTRIYRTNGFGGMDSVSGPGSDIIQTALIRKELPNIFKELNVSSMLDIPCGDLNWIRTIDLGDIKYIGADIVRDIVRDNNLNYRNENMLFKHLNLNKDDLPKVDIVLCRDCLVHLSFRDIFLALRNIYRSKSTYLLTTTYSDRDLNQDILTGDWRTLNLCLPPFNLCPPIRLINEKCTEADGQFADKCLGLWRIEDILVSLQDASLSILGKKV